MHQSHRRGEDTVALPSLDPMIEGLRENCDQERPFIIRLCYSLAFPHQLPSTINDVAFLARSSATKATVCRSELVKSDPTRKVDWPDTLRSTMILPVIRSCATICA